MAEDSIGTCRHRRDQPWSVAGLRQKATQGGWSWGGASGQLTHSKSLARLGL
jgi:hypothetical protein